MSDYLERQRVIKTYTARHGMMTQGLGTEKYDLEDPEGWTPEVQTPAVTQIMQTTDNREDPNLIWDSDLEDWMPVSSC